MKTIKLPKITIREIEESDIVCQDCRYKYKMFCNVGSSVVENHKCPYMLERLVLEQNNEVEI